LQIGYTHPSKLSIINNLFKFNLYNSVSIKKVSYGTTTIQKLRRVSLDQNLLETLRLEVGDSVRIELDTEQEAVIITRAANAVSSKGNEQKVTRRQRAKR